MSIAWQSWVWRSWQFFPFLKINFLSIKNLARWTAHHDEQFLKMRNNDTFMSARKRNTGKQCAMNAYGVVPCVNQKDRQGTKRKWCKKIRILASNIPHFVLVVVISMPRLDTAWVELRRVHQAWSRATVVISCCIAITLCGSLRWTLRFIKMINEME